MSDYVTEAEALDDANEDGTTALNTPEYDPHESWKQFADEVSRGQESDLEVYYANREAKVGSTIICPYGKCRKKFTKRSYQHAFCCTKHKDRFWNRQRLLII